MALQWRETALKGIKIIQPDVFGDARGFFMETYHVPKYRQMGIDVPFIQDNHSRSRYGIIRGLHYQLSRPQGKLITVVRGSVYDVAVDIRKGSPTFGQWIGEELSEENHAQIYVPPGFAHAFCVTSETADVLYKCSDVYDPADEYGVLWSDPDLAIPWPVAAPIVSQKDARLLPLKEIPLSQLPEYRAS